MAADRDRQHLYAALETSLGEGPATTLMSLLPPQGWDDVVRRPDLAATRADLKSDMAELKSDMAELKGDVAELRGEMAELKAELKGDVAELRGDGAEVKGEVAELRARIDAQVPKFLLANIPVVLSTAGLVLAAVKLG